MNAINSIGIGQSTAPPPPIEVSDRARTELLKILEDENPPAGTGLRVQVLKGGCSGLSWEMEFTERRDSDIEIALDGLSVFIDAESSVFMSGTVLDYQGGLKGRGFVFSNPNASKTCSCGDSFRL